jgi:hypothetical protein
MNSSHAANPSVIIHIRERTNDDKHHSAAARQPDAQPARLFLLSEMRDRARADQSAALARTAANVSRRTELNQQRDELVRDEAAFPLQDRRVRRCAGVSFLLGAAAASVCLPLGIAQSSLPLLASSYVLGFAGFGSGGVALMRARWFELDIAARRTTLEGEGQRLDALESQTQRETKRANTAVARSEAALTQRMRAFVMDQLKQHTTIAEDPAGIVADYVGTNEDPPQAQG